MFLGAISVGFGADMLAWVWWEAVGGRQQLTMRRDLLTAHDAVGSCEHLSPRASIQDRDVW